MKETLLRLAEERVPVGGWRKFYY